MDWRVYVAWECDVKRDPDNEALKVNKFLFEDHSS